MAGNTSLITQILKETAARNCHSCGSQFRGDRRRHVECHLSVCNKCFCQYSAAVRKQSSLHEFEGFDNTSDMDIDVTISNKQETVCYYDAEIQTDFTFPPNILCSLCTPSDTNTRSSTIIDFTDSVSLPFCRLPKSTRKCSLCKIYFSGSTVSIPDCARIDSLLNDNIFIQSGSRTHENHLVENYLKQSVTTNIIKDYPDTCVLKIEELMEMLETIKNELNMLNLKNKELIKKPPVSFDDSYRFTSDEYHTLTGLYREQFDKLCSDIPTFAIYNTELRSSRQAIAMLINKASLRT